MKKNFKKIITIVILLGILFSVIVFTDLFNTKEAEAEWYSTGGTWSYRKTITIDHNKVPDTNASGGETDFPVLIDITDASLQANAKSDGFDILFTSSDGSTKLSHEREVYTTATGRLTAWVKVPVLSSTVDTVIYMYYGNAGATDQADPTNVWTSYSFVNHLGDGSTVDVNTSTSNNYDAVNNSSLPAAIGKIYGGVNYDASAKFLSWVDDYADFSGNFTVSFWMKLNAGASGNGMIIFGQQFGATDYNIIYISTATQKLSSQIRDNNLGPSTQTISNSALSTTNWLYITMTMDDSLTPNVIGYVNGDALSATHSADMRMTELEATTLYLGRAVTYFSNANAKFDEVRFIAGIRSADWIATEYNNQNSPSSFYSISGADDTVPDTNVKAGGSTIKVRGGVKFR